MSPLGNLSRLMALALILVAIAAWIAIRHRSHEQQPPAQDAATTHNGNTFSTAARSTTPAVKKPAINLGVAASLHVTTNAMESSLAQLVVQELRNYEDPSAEQLIDLLSKGGWSTEEQLARFKEAYDQLLRMNQFDDLAADNRIEMRQFFESVETNRIDSIESRRQSRHNYMALREMFEEEMHSRKTATLSNLLVFLGPPPQMGVDELQRRLLEIHPLMTIHGPITNSLPQPAPAP